MTLNGFFSPFPDTTAHALFEDYALSLAFSVSYLCLFIVLTLYKYEVMFRTGVLLVAIIGLFFPMLYGLPYIFIVWRVFIGLNVSTDQKLFIGRHISNSNNNSTEQNDMDKADFSGSTTLNHWVVVIQDGACYMYTHAVGYCMIPLREGTLLIYPRLVQSKGIAAGCRCVEVVE